MPPAPKAFVPGYEWDIFISYAHQDNEARFGKHWVSDFASELQTAIRARLGHSEIRVFRDQEVLQGNATLDQLLPAARSSAIFLAICSPSYVVRPWTRDEVKAFAAANPDPSRLFGIDMLSVDGEKYPPELGHHIRQPFWDKQGPKGIPTTISLQWGTEMYCQRIEALASEIAEKLEHLHEVAQAKRPDLPVAGASKPAPSAVKTVLLAMTFEEQKRLNKLKNSLLQYPKDIRVVYAGDFPLGGADFKARFTEAVQEADLMVQIFGDTPGPTPADLPEGYTSLQMELANHYKVPMWQWRSPGLDLSEIEDENYLKMLQAESVEVTSLDELREKILAFGRRPAPSANIAPSPETVLFINAHAADRALAESIKSSFAGELEVRFSPTMFGPGAGKSKKVREMLALNFRESDVIVFLYRKSDADWLKSQYDFLKNLQGYQLNPAVNATSLEVKAKKLGVVYIGPPSNLPVYNSLPYIRELPSPPDGDLEPLLKLIREALV